MPETTVRNKNWRETITVIEEMPGLDNLGKAGARLKLDLMLAATHGHSERDWQRLNAEEREVLRQMAREEDPAWGVSHQADAIGALGQLRDQAAQLQLGDLARNSRADLRLQIAATHALGEIGGEQVRPLLRELLEARSPEVRAQAALGLVKTGTAADLAALEMRLDQDQTFAADVAREAVEALSTRLKLR
jgi:hypothetical protein